MTPIRVELPTPATEMAQEEIRKNLCFLSQAISDVRFSDDGKVLEFEAPEGERAKLRHDAEDVASRVARALRGLERKVVFRSARRAPTNGYASDVVSGITIVGTGQVLLQGTPLRLFRYFERRFEEIAAAWSAVPVRVPALISSDVLGRCDYFGAFPQYLTFAAHLDPDPAVTERFRKRHEGAITVDEGALQELTTPQNCLTPALCYHVYHSLEHHRLADLSSYVVCGPCFRYEGGGLTDLRRLWNFTMHELVFVGSRESVLEARSHTIERFSTLVDELELGGEVRTASDPFFASPEAVAKTYFQLRAEAKLEVSLFVGEGERTAVTSFNYHGDFFGKAFDVRAGDGYMHSVCVGCGLERWVLAFVRQHGSDLSHWPHVVRSAQEFDGCT